MAGEQDAMPAVLKANLLHTWAKMKTQSDKRRFNVHFQVGDWVLLNLQPQDSGHKPKYSMTIQSPGYLNRRKGKFRSPITFN
jgi:exosome complex RNA-binding protein Rrp4